jgi:two-component system chemotaxis response regulator CheY
MKVLLVDDDPVMRLAVCAALEAAGHSVLEAAGGAEALALAADADIDVLLLDVVLDDEDGAAVAAALRALPHLSQVPLVFLTGRAEADGTRLLALGAAGVLAKPFDITALAADVERFQRR